MPRVKGYSLWLKPEGDVFTTLTNLINKLSSEYSAPTFEPHITLLGEVELLEKEMLDRTSKLAKRIHSYEIQFIRPEFLDEFYRCIFLKVKETKNVMEANLKARRMFDRLNDSKYMPHMSVLYGYFSRETKKKIISEIGDKFNLNFKVDRIHLYSTNGECKDWYEVRQFYLK